jgi:hypothetical protein
MTFTRFPFFGSNFGCRIKIGRFSAIFLMGWKHYARSSTPDPKNKCLRKQVRARNSGKDTPKESKIRHSTRTIASKNMKKRTRGTTVVHAASLVKQLPKNWISSHPPVVGEKCIYIPHHTLDMGQWMRGRVKAINECNSNCELGMKMVIINRCPVTDRKGILTVPFDHVCVPPPYFYAGKKRNKL